MTIIFNTESRKYTVNWRQNPQFLNLFQTGKSLSCRNSWKIAAYLHAMVEIFGQSTGSSTAVTPSLLKYFSIQLRTYKQATLQTEKVQNT
jgi:hypothetical protein